MPKVWLTGCIALMQVRGRLLDRTKKTLQPVMRCSLGQKIKIVSIVCIFRDLFSSVVSSKSHMNVTSHSRSCEEDPLRRYCQAESSIPVTSRGNDGEAHLFTHTNETVLLSAAHQSSSPRADSSEIHLALSTSLADNPQLLSQLLSSSVMDPATDRLWRT